MYCAASSGLSGAAPAGNIQTPNAAAAAQCRLVPQRSPIRMHADLQWSNINIIGSTSEHILSDSWLDAAFCRLTGGLGYFKIEAAAVDIMPHLAFSMRTR
jgi:hypothetical protein